MKHYTKSEIKEILERHEGVELSFSVEDRDNALINPSLDIFLRVLKSDTAELKTQADAVIPFSLFRRYEEDGNRKEYEKTAPSVDPLTEGVFAFRVAAHSTIRCFSQWAKR